MKRFPRPLPTTVFKPVMPLTKNKPVEELHDRAHPERDREKNKREAKTQRCSPEKMAETSFFFRMEDSISMI